MKNPKRTISYSLYALLACVFISCSHSSQEQVSVEPLGITQQESGISFVGKYEVMEHGMKYVIYREVDGGLFILNITKDSLEVANLRNER